jgi:hypothetical protein
LQGRDFLLPDTSFLDRVDIYPDLLVLKLNERWRGLVDQQYAGLFSVKEVFPSPKEMEWLQGGKFSLPPSMSTGPPSCPSLLEGGLTSFPSNRLDDGRLFEVDRPLPSAPRGRAAGLLSCTGVVLRLFDAMG